MIHFSKHMNSVRTITDVITAFMRGADLNVANPQNKVISLHYAPACNYFDVTIIISRVLFLYE